MLTFMEINQSNILYKTGPREGVPYLFSLESERGKNLLYLCRTGSYSKVSIFNLQLDPK